MATSRRIPVQAYRSVALATLVAFQANAPLACDPSKPTGATDVSVPPPASASVAPPLAPERSGALNLRVTVERDAWTVDAQGLPGTGACAAISDLPALTRCAQSHKATFPDETRVVVTSLATVSKM